MNKKRYFANITWGSRLFVNGQFAIEIVALIGRYVEGKTTLQDIFEYIEAIKKQKDVHLYADIQKTVAYLTELQEAIAMNIVTNEDTKVISFVLGNVFLDFTKSTCLLDAV